MNKQERIAKLNWVLSLIGELESEGVYMPETKANVINRINELSAC
jgi:hypothetical protein